MTDFKIPNIPDDEVSPLRPDFKWMSYMIGISIPLFAFTFLFFYIFSNFIISKLDLKDEKTYFGNSFLDKSAEKMDLTKFSYKIILPEYIDVYIIESPEINAFASIGGNVLFTTSLIEKLKYEEEFLFILGHEIEHIKNRDVIKSFSTKIPFYITLAFLGMEVGFNYDNIFNITNSYISRQIEINSDIGGIDFVKNNGGNTDCILNFFESKNNIFEKYLNFSSTHPTNEERIKQIKKYSLGNNNDFSKCRNIDEKLFIN